MRRIISILAFSALSALIAIDCSDESASNGSYIHVTITAPPRDTTLIDPPVKITAHVDASCGCQRYVEFSIDDSLHYTDFAGPYEYIWDFQRSSGTHTIRARGVLVGKATGGDSVTVTIQ